MNKIFRGTLEVKTCVLDQNAISDSSDPLREVARHVSTPCLAWTQEHWRRFWKDQSVLFESAGLEWPGPEENTIFIKGSLRFHKNISSPLYAFPPLHYRFLIPGLTDNVTIYWSELADLKECCWTPGVLPDTEMRLKKLALYWIFKKSRVFKVDALSPKSNRSKSGSIRVKKLNKFVLTVCRSWLLTENCSFFSTQSGDSVSYRRSSPSSRLSDWSAVSSSQLKRRSHTQHN